MQSEIVADVLVVSDIHAMSPDVDVGRFKQFVDLHPAKRLVLAGDTLDFYMWRHGRRVKEEAGVELLEYLVELADIGVELVILPGNHDMDWMWLAGHGKVPKRYLKDAFPDQMQSLLMKLVKHEHVKIVAQHKEGDTVIVHGHEGWQGDWLWRLSEMGDRATRYKMVGRQFRRNVMGGAPMGMRGAAVEWHGFYRRLAAWGKKIGVARVIHGHTHVDGRRERQGIVLDCLPAWRPSEGMGGGMRYKDGAWERLVCDL